MTIEEKEISINGLKVNYRIAGEGQLILNSERIKVLPGETRQVLILHGWGGSSDSWVKVMKILAREGFKVVCPDFPGFGKSKTPSFPWGLDDYAEWLNEFADFLNLEEFFLVAHSFGGRIAVKFTTICPEKIKKLILCASAGIKPKPGLKTRVVYRLARVGNAVFTPRHLERFKDGAKNVFYVFLRNKDYVKAKGTMKETIKKVLEEDLLPELSQIKIKTLLLWGGNDKLVPLKYARIFKEEIENSELVILPKIGHSPHLEVPEKTSKIILNFIS